jgi:hypothetical protein
MERTSVMSLKQKYALKPVYAHRKVELVADVAVLVRAADVPHDHALSNHVNLRECRQV